MESKFEDFFYKMIRIICLLVFLVVIDSCTVKTTTKTIQASNLGLDELEGSEFFVDQIKNAEIRNCISTDNKVKASIKNFDKNNIGGEIVNSQVSRKIIQRGNLSKGVPKDHLKESLQYDFFLCVNRAGEVSLAKLIKSNPALDQTELKQLMSVVFDYKYENKSDSDCLECGKLIIKKD